MIDTDTIEKYILGGEWENQYPQVIEYLLAEVKRLKKELAFYTDNCTVVWMLDDVLSVDNTLSDEQASWVLERMEHKHDACLGISWDTIEFWISEVKKND